MDKEFVKLVAEMRHAQKSYFKTRRREWLIKSKALEIQVDMYITNLNIPTLFS